MVAPLGVFFARRPGTRWGALLVCAALLRGPAALGAQDEAYLAELIGKSRQLRLAERGEWRKLLHYLPNLVLPGVHSLVDSPNFFNAADGKTNPQSELEATLAGFFSDLSETAERQNPQCAFIARRAWLDEQLGFDPKRMPQQPCTRFRQWRESLDPAGLTLIFASAYLNSPSSMYGHTLVRVDARDQDDRTRLLAYAISFQANTDETNGLAFALNGLFGGYPGTFSILPYYIKVREYSDLENRDIWEYELALTPVEVDRVLRHAWELGPAYFQYFFFDENCSYQLLGLLQVARPEMDLVGPFRGWALPTDTVRVVAEQPGLVRRTVYRPANATLIRRRVSLLSGEERALVRGLGLGRIAEEDAALAVLPAGRAAAVLEASHDYLMYRRALGRKDVPDPDALARRLLVARSRLDVPPQTPEVAAPEVRPEQGHGTARIGAGAGRRDGVNFQELRLRATYHGIMDPEEGYARGAQIEFFDSAFRRYESGSTRLESLTPIDIVSLAPRDDFFQPWSWKIAAGWTRVRVSDGGEPLIPSVDGGGGVAWATDDHRLFYAFADGSARAHHRLDEGYALGAGASVGALLDWSSRWRTHAYARGLRYFLGQRDTPTALGLEQRVTLGRDVALRLDLARNREMGHSFNVGSAAVLFYF